MLFVFYEYFAYLKKNRHCKINKILISKVNKNQEGLEIKHLIRKKSTRCFCHCVVRKKKELTNKILASSAVG